MAVMDATILRSKNLRIRNLNLTENSSDNTDFSATVWFFQPARVITTKCRTVKICNS